MPTEGEPKAKRSQNAVESEPQRARKADVVEGDKQARRRAIRDGLDLPVYSFVDIDFYWSRNAMGVKLRNCVSIEDRGKQATRR